MTAIKFLMAAVIIDECFVNVVLLVLIKNEQT